MHASDSVSVPVQFKFNRHVRALDVQGRVRLRVHQQARGRRRCHRRVRPQWAARRPLVRRALRLLEQLRPQRLHGLPVPGRLRGSNHLSAGTRALQTGAASQRGAVPAAAVNCRSGQRSAYLALRGGGCHSSVCSRSDEDEDARAVRHPGERCAGCGQRLRVHSLLHRWLATHRRTNLEHARSARDRRWRATCGSEEKSEV